MTPLLSLVYVFELKKHGQVIVIEPTHPEKKIYGILINEEVKFYDNTEIKKV